MWQGKVIELYIAPQASGPVQAVSTVLAVPGSGLEGDRYFMKAGTFSQTPGAGREVTLIASEDLLALQRDYGLSLAPGASRRNIVTSDVPLNYLVGKTFRIGEAVLRGVRLCEPCKHLASLTDKSILRSMVHRGGLRADIVKGGTINLEDTIEEISE